MKFNSNSTFQQPPIGAHTATLVKIVDIGTQVGEYKGEKTKRRQCIFTWELPEETMDDGQPFIISKFYTTSLGEKANLTKDLTAWFGKAPNPDEFDPEALLGKSCQVIVSGREGSDKKVISGLAPLSKSVKVPSTPHNAIVFFDLDKFSQDTFDGLSNGIQGMITKSPEYAAIINGEVLAAEPDASDVEIPF